MSNASGFSLIELVVVMTLFGLLMAMMPSSLLTRFDSLSLESRALGVASNVRQCSIKAQSLQRTVSWGSPGCPIFETDEFVIRLSKEQPLTFYRDGSSSGEQILVSAVVANQKSTAGPDAYMVNVDNITSLTEVVVVSDAGADK